MLISAIVAVSKNNVIGKNGTLPWHLQADLKRFKALTTGHHIILGRKNYEDIGKPLPNRTNLVLSRNKDFKANGCIVCNSLEKALLYAKEAHETECFIIGGGVLYKEALPLCQKLYVTRVEADILGDVFFEDYSKDFKVISKEYVLADEKNDYPTTFMVMERITL